MKEQVITYVTQKGVPANGRNRSTACVIIDADSQEEARAQFTKEYPDYPIKRIQTVR